MAYTGCDCGVGLWDGYVPGGVSWDIFPKWQAEAAISKHPEYGIADVGDYISETYDNDEFIEVWLCRRCRRIQIRDQYNKYVSYKKTAFNETTTLEEILEMEEWLAYSDWGLEEECTLKYALAHQENDGKIVVEDIAQNSKSGF